MEIAVLLEPLEGGGFRAKAGEPFNLSAEGANTADATRQLALRIDALLAAGRQMATLTVANGAVVVPPALPFPADNAYETDWVFRELQEAIAENRRQEDAANL